MTEEHDQLGFNFWPSFADLMLSLVFILILILFLVSVVITAGSVNLEQVEKNQMGMIKALASNYRVEPHKLDKKEYGDNAFGISTSNGPTNDVIIKNETTLQRIYFSDHILFPSNGYKLNPKGEEILTIVGNTIKQQLNQIIEIQIQGHADPDATKLLPSNLYLGSYRAIAVFNFFQDQVGIDPSEHLMSATSFGEFKPVQRQEGSAYNHELLMRDNKTTQLKDQNRRIELLLIYQR